MLIGKPGDTRACRIMGPGAPRRNNPEPSGGSGGTAPRVRGQGFGPEGIEIPTAGLRPGATPAHVVLLSNAGPGFACIRSRRRTGGRSDGSEGGGPMVRRAA